MAQTAHIFQEKSPPATLCAGSCLAQQALMRLDNQMTGPTTSLTAKDGADIKERHEDLLLRVGRSQDRDAFIALFQYFAPRVKSYLLKHGASEAAAEEAVQNTFVTVWEKAARYDTRKAAASTWIFTIARNKRIDALRREKFIEPGLDSAALDNMPAPQDTPYVDSETADALHHAISDLPPEQAALLRMAFFDEKSHQTIAQETQLPLGTVKSRLRLALKKLQHALGKKDKGTSA